MKDSAGSQMINVIYRLSNSVCIRTRASSITLKRKSIEVYKLIVMNLSTRISNFGRFKQFIETHHKDGKIPRAFEYDLTREIKLNNSEEKKKD